MNFSRHQYYELLRVVQHLLRGWNRLRHPETKLDGRGRAAFYNNIWEGTAKRLGAEFIRLPNGFCEVRLNGKSTRMYENIVQIDDPLIVKLVKVKPFVSKQLSEHGIPVPKFHEFTLETLKAAEEFMREVNTACVVKPISGESAGSGVTTNIRTRRELQRAAITASLSDRNLMIEEQVEGVSYRLMVLDGKVLDATRRHPPTVVGDGRSSVRQLIEAENKRRNSQSGSASLTRIQYDSDCEATLKKQGMSLHSVPAAGMAVTVKTAVNDNAPTDNVSARGEIGDTLANDVARASTILGIRLAGVDIITKDPRISLKDGGGVIIEVNSSPGLHHHYNVNNPGDTTDVALPVLRSLLGIEERKGPNIDNRVMEKEL